MQGAWGTKADLREVGVGQTPSCDRSFVFLPPPLPLAPPTVTLTSPSTGTGTTWTNIPPHYRPKIRVVSRPPSIEKARDAYHLRPQAPANQPLAPLPIPMDPP